MTIRFSSHVGDGDDVVVVMFSGGLETKGALVVEVSGFSLEARLAHMSIAVNEKVTIFATHGAVVVRRW